MTNEERQLLVKDLCARQPYKVKISVDDDNLFIPTLKYIDRITCHFYECAWTEYIDNIKPYFRSMSSMTDGEKDYIKNVARFKQSDGIHYDDGVHYVPIYQETLDDQWKTDGKFPPILDDIYRFMLEYGYILLIDFFNSHHLDYRGLIPRGLALEAPEDMYNTKTE